MTRSLRSQVGEWATAYIFLSPWLFVFVVFNVVAIGTALYLSFTKYDLFSAPQWIGLKGYADVLSTELFSRAALPNTLKYVAVVVPVQTALSLVIAFVLNQKIRARRFFRTAYYLPSVTSSVVISLIFLWLFANTGLINQIFRANVQWLTSTTWALPTIMMVNIWSTTGTMMLIFLAGLQDIPQSIYEAAQIDGASTPQTFLYVTIPMLRPVIFFVVTLGIIGTFQVFDQIYVMTAGGPLDSTTTMAYLIFKWAFRDTTPRMGQASALAFILGLMIFVVTMLNRRLIEGGGATAER